MIAQEERHEASIRRETFTKEREIAFELGQTAKLREEQMRESTAHSAASAQNQELQKRIEQIVLENTNYLEEKVRVCLNLFNMQEQLLERETVMMNKEQGLKAAVHVQKSLENFRFILEHKIQLFKEEKERIENKIENKESNIKKLFAEMLQQSTKNTEKAQQITLAQQLLAIMGHELLDTKSKSGLLCNFSSNINRKVRLVLADKEMNALQRRRKLKTLLEEFKAADVQKKKFGEFDKNENSQNYASQIGRNERLKLEISKLVNGIKAREQYTQKTVLIHQNKNRNMIEECNKLIEENDCFEKLLKQMDMIIGEGVEAKNEISSKMRLKGKPRSTSKD